MAHKTRTSELFPRDLLFSKGPRWHYRLCSTLLRGWRRYVGTGLEDIYHWRLVNVLDVCPGTFEAVRLTYPEKKTAILYRPFPDERPDVYRVHVHHFLLLCDALRLAIEVNA